MGEAEKCRCALSYSAMDDTLYSLKRVVEDRGLPSEAWSKVLVSNLDKVEQDCGVTLPELRRDLGEAYYDALRKGDIRGLLGAIETARVRLPLDFLKCERGE